MGYVWCDGYVWDMCGVRYANNLLKNPATKRLSGKKKNIYIYIYKRSCMLYLHGNLTGIQGYYQLGDLLIPTFYQNQKMH